MSRLDELEAMLRDGIQRSGQLSLGRRAPQPEAMPILEHTRTALRGYVEANPADARGWRLLSLAEETLLAYPRALAAIRRAIELAGRTDKRDRKRVGALVTATNEWTALQLQGIELAELATFLDEQSSAGFESTRRWLEDHDKDDERVLAVFVARGARCDADVADIAKGKWL
ncbi:MAG: hypothetical protein ABI867_12930 [Kofleriaceae bacterium]